MLPRSLLILICRMIGHNRRMNHPRIINHPGCSHRPVRGVPKEHPFETILDCFACQHDGFVYTTPWLSRLEAVSRDLFCSALHAMFFNVLLGTTFPRFVVNLGARGGLRGGTTKDTRTPFSAFCFRPPLRALGKQGLLKHTPRPPK